MGAGTALRGPLEEAHRKNAVVSFRRHHWVSNGGYRIWGTKRVTAQEKKTRTATGLFLPSGWPREKKEIDATTHTKSDAESDGADSCNSDLVPRVGRRDHVTPAGDVMRTRAFGILDSTVSRNAIESTEPGVSHRQGIALYLDVPYLYSQRD